LKEEKVVFSVLVSTATKAKGIIVYPPKTKKEPMPRRKAPVLHVDLPTARQEDVGWSLKAAAEQLTQMTPIHHICDVFPSRVSRIVSNPQGRAFFFLQNKATGESLLHEIDDAERKEEKDSDAKRQWRDPDFADWLGPVALTHDSVFVATQKGTVARELNHPATATPVFTPWNAETLAKRESIVKFQPVQHRFFLLIRETRATVMCDTVERAMAHDVIARLEGGTRSKWPRIKTGHQRLPEFHVLYERLPDKPFNRLVVAIEEADIRDFVLIGNEAFVLVHRQASNESRVLRVAIPPLMSHKVPSVLETISFAGELRHLAVQWQGTLMALFQPFDGRTIRHSNPALFDDDGETMAPTIVQGIQGRIYLLDVPRFRLMGCIPCMVPRALVFSHDKLVYHFAKEDQNPIILEVLLEAQRKHPTNGGLQLLLPETEETVFLSDSLSPCLETYERNLSNQEAKLVDGHELDSKSRHRVGKKKPQEQGRSKRKYNKKKRRR